MGGFPKRLHNNFKWQNTKIIPYIVAKDIWQVVKSMMVAYTLVLVDALEALFWLTKLFVEIFSTAEISFLLPLNCYNDSNIISFRYTLIVT